MIVFERFRKIDWSMSRIGTSGSTRRLESATEENDHKQKSEGSHNKLLARPRLRPARGIRRLDCADRSAAGFSGLANGGRGRVVMGENPLYEQSTPLPL